MRLVFLAVGAGAIAAALAFGGGGADPRSDGGNRETVLVLDASNSMFATDVEPNRLIRQRQLALMMASRLPGKIGIVYFAGRAYVLSPLTDDRQAVMMYVEAVDPGAVGRGGTALAGGLRQALDLLAGGTTGARRSIVLFTDGESTLEEDELAPVIQRAVRDAVPIYAVGLGTEAGGRIEVPDADTPADDRVVLRDASGEVVTSRLAASPLRQLAMETGGVYAPGDERGLSSLTTILAGRGAAGPGRPTSAGNLLLLLAFILLFGEAFLFRRS
jgi:Ca-activated chloride channel family protein